MMKNNIMERCLLLLVSIPVVFSVAARSSVAGTGQPRNFTIPNMNHTNPPDDKATLSALNARFIKNFLNQDTVAHNEIIHKDFLCIESSGAIVPRDEYMKGWAHGYENSGYNTFSYTDEHIRLFGNMALVRSRTVFTKLVNGELVEGNSIYTDTYVKENGRWWCVQAHLTRVSK